jgi:hypothetical protein
VILDYSATGPPEEQDDGVIFATYARPPQACRVMRLCCDTDRDLNRDA